MDGPIPVEVYHTNINGLPVYLVSGPPFPPGAPVYSGDNAVDGYKYTFFSIAALKLPFVLGWQPDILHANDWHTALSIHSLKQTLSADKFYSRIRTILSIHNLAFLGTGAGTALHGFGLTPATGSPLPEWAQDLPLPLGLLAADQIVAGSPNQAREILSPEFGCGLDEFLQSRQASISGILYGIDYHLWDPATDRNVPTNYSIKDISCRDANKTVLAQEIGLDPSPRLPLLAMFTPLQEQERTDLAFDALRQLAQSDPVSSWQFIIIGKGDSNLETASKKLESDFPQHVRALFQDDQKLLSRIYAGADMILLPFRNEPGGLVQMIAMHYGCVPVACATGGLSDTIRDAHLPRGNGFIFEKPESYALKEAISRALQFYSNRPRWKRLQRYGMTADFSWENSARQYMKLYYTMLAKNT
jgi:starch synthase